MNIRFKVFCESVTHHNGGSQTVVLRPVHSDSEENKTFSKYTPSGRFEFVISNPDAAGAYEPGKEYILTSSPVPTSP